MRTRSQISRRSRTTFHDNYPQVVSHDYESIYRFRVQKSTRDDEFLTSTDRITHQNDDETVAVHDRSRRVARRAIHNYEN